MDIGNLLHVKYDYQIKSSPNEILKNENYSKIVHELLRDKRDYFISADVGYGKTTGIIKLAALDKRKILLVLPLKANVLELEEFCKSRGIKVGVIKSLPKNASKKQRARRDIEIKNNLLDDEIYIYLSVYDNINLVCKNADSQLLKYDFNLVIDEAHNLITSYRYRTKAIEDIIKSAPNFKKTILISGTPEGTIDNNSDCTKIHFSSPTENIIKSHVKELKIIKYNSDKLKKLLHHVIKNNVKGKIVILINNRREIKQFAEMLKLQLSAEDAGKIFVLSSDYKNEELFLEIAKSKYLPENVKFLITTSVIAEGMNILNDDIELIYMLEVDDWWLKRQFIGRFRLGVNFIYDFMNYKHEYPQMWIDPVIARNNLLKYAQHIADAKNEINKSGFLKILSGEESQIVSLDKENNIEKWNTGEFKVNHRMIDINVIEKLNRIMALDPERAKEFYQTVAGFNNVSIVDYDADIEKSYFNKNKYTVSNSIINDELSNNFINLLNAHIYFKKPTIYASKTFDRSIIDNCVDPVEFKTKYYNLIESENFLTNLFDYLIKLLSENFPIGYLRYLFHLKLEKPNINLKYEVRKFENLLIRDMLYLDNDIIELFQKSRRHRKFNILWDLNKELEHKDYIEVNDLKKIYSQICAKYNHNSSSIQEAYDIINSIYSSGNLQCRHGNLTYFYVKPIGIPKTYSNLYSISADDISRYNFKLHSFYNESLNNLTLENSLQSFSNN